MPALRASDYSAAVPVECRDKYPDLIEPTRAALIATGLPYIIENVPGSPLRADLRLCGCQFGLWRLKRERWFECSWQPSWSKPKCNHPEPVISIIGKMGFSYGRNLKRIGFHPDKSDWERAMGIDWMSTRGISQAIPPALHRVHRPPIFGERMQHGTHDKCKHGNRICSMCVIVSDAAKRASDVVNSYAVFTPYEDLINCYVALRLSDGGHDGTLYYSKREAVRHQSDEKLCAYLQLSLPRHQRCQPKGHATVP
jgi:hypothetical protein